MRLLGDTLVATALTDSNGEFVVPAARTDYTLTLTRDGYVPIEGLAVRWDERDSSFKVLDDQDLDGWGGLIMRRQTGQITVQVTVTPSWIPQAQRLVTVRLIGGAQERSAEVTGAPVTFTDVPVGDYVVYVQRPGFSFTQRSVQLTGNLDPQVELFVRLEDLAAARLTLAGLALTDANLRAVPNLKGANLSGVTIRGSSTDTADLCNIDLSEVSLVGSDLTGARLTGAILVGARLDNSTLSGADLSGADLAGASLFGANLASANLARVPVYDCLSDIVCDEGSCNGRTNIPGQRTHLDGADFSSANLLGATFAPEGAQPTQFSCESEQARDTPTVLGTRWNQADLSDASLVGMDMRGLVLNNTLMIDTDLSGSCLTGATLSGVDLSDATLDDADAARLNLVATITEGASFQRAHLPGARMVGLIMGGVDWTDAVLSEADLRSTEWIDTTLAGADFTQANLRNAVFSQEDLTAVEMGEAQLNNAVFSGARIVDTNLTGAVLSGADLRLAMYSAETRWPDGFEHRTIGALGPETQLSDLRLPNGFAASGVDLSNANLQGIRWLNGDLTGASFQGADLQGAQLSGSRLPGANLTATNLTDAELTGAILTGAVLDSTVLVETRMEGADLTGATLMNIASGEFSSPDLADFSANLTAALLQDATLTDAALTGMVLIEADMTGATLTRVLTDGIKDGCPALLPTTEWSCVQESDAHPGRRATEGTLHALIGPGADLTDANLGGLLLTGRTMSGAALANVNLRQAQTHGLLGTCPTSLPEPWRCVQQAQGQVALIGPEANLDGAQLAQSDLDGVNAYLLTRCPSNLPRNWQCEQSDGESGRFLIGPGANLNGVDLGGVCFDGLDLSNANLAGAKTGRVCDCPNALPEEWVCLLSECGEGGEGESAVLVGPAADLSEAYLGCLDLSDASLDGVRGDAIEACPDAMPQGWACLETSQPFTHALVGPGADLRDVYMFGVDLNGVDLTGAITWGFRGSCNFELPDGWRCVNNGRMLIEVGYRAELYPQVLAILGPGVNVSGLHFTNSPVQFPSDINLSQADLSGCTFENISLDINLAGADMTNSTWTNVELGWLGGDMITDLSDADLTDAQLNGVSIYGGLGGERCPAQLPQGWECRTTSEPSIIDQNIFSHLLFGPGLDGLSAVNLSGYVTHGLMDCPRLSGGVNTPRCVYQGAVDRWALVGPGVNLAGADLSDTALSEATLSRADLSGADLSGADLSGATCLQTNLSGTNLDGGDLSGTTIFYSDFTNAILTQTYWEGAEMLSGEWGGTVWGGADLRGLMVRTDEGDQLNLSTAALTGARSHSILMELVGEEEGEGFGLCPQLPAGWACVFQPSVDRWAFVGPGVDLSEADLNGADLSEVDLTDATCPDGQAESQNPRCGF